MDSSHLVQAGGQIETDWSVLLFLCYGVSRSSERPNDKEAIYHGTRCAIIHPGCTDTPMGTGSRVPTPPLPAT